jgi:CheY-like chemotaxis protein
MFNNKEKLPKLIIPNMIEICKELNNKMTMVLNLPNIHKNPNTNEIEINEIKAKEIEKKAKIHEEKINKLIEKYNEILKKKESELLPREDMVVILNEVIFCFEIIDICIYNIQKTVENRDLLINTSQEIIEFINIFIANYINNQHDMVLTIKSVDINLLFNKVEKILKNELKKNNKTINKIINGKVENSSKYDSSIIARRTSINNEENFILGDEFMLFYVFTHIIYYILKNIDNDEEINIDLITEKNDEDLEKCIEIYVKINYMNKDVNCIDIFDYENILFICNKIIIAHNGKMNCDMETICSNKNKKEINIVIPILTSITPHYVPALSFANIESFNLQNAGVKTPALVPDFPYGISGGGIPLKNTDRTTCMTDCALEVKSSKKEQITKKITESISYEGTENQLHVEELKIICIDDSIMNLKFITRFVAKTFFNDDYNKIETLGNGCELINRLIEGKEYDIIFIDNNMPNLKGSVVIKVIRSLGCKSLIICITGDNIEIENNEILKNGGNKVYKKPFKKEDMTFLYDFYLQNYKTDFSNRIIKRKETGELYT